MCRISGEKREKWGIARRTGDLLELEKGKEEKGEEKSSAKRIGGAKVGWREEDIKKVHYCFTRKYR